MSHLQGDVDRLYEHPVSHLDCLAALENLPDEYSERSLTDDSFYEGVDSARFLKLDRLGEGQYATVYRAQSLAENNKIVAIKYLRLLTAPENLHLTGTKELHEVEILSKLSHPNVVRFLDYFCQGRQKAVVLEFMDFSLDVLLKDVSSYPVLLPQVMYYVGNIVRGLVYLHEQKVIHRDLKPNNILVNKAGEVKIGDFGCSRRQEGDARYSKQFACRSYRPPEIILSAKVYNQTVDMWALGCIVAEFYRKGPLFVGSCDIDQICTIARTLGSPKAEDYRTDQISGLQLGLEVYPRKSIVDILPIVHPTMAEVMENCLVYDIDRRWTSQICLDYLVEEEVKYPPCLPQDLLRLFAKASVRKTAKRKSKFDADTSNSDLMEISPLQLDDVQCHEVSFQSPLKRTRSRSSFTQSKLSPPTSARKKLCF